MPSSEDQMQRLSAAAREGNIEVLNELIESSAGILEEMDDKWAGYTPLHVACAYGHSNLVDRLLTMKPRFAERKDADGFSPLHIAAARGNSAIMTGLLAVGAHLCSVKGPENRIPLHYAIENGALDAIVELLSAWPESVEKTTAQEETVLHLAVKSNRFDVVRELVEHLKQHKMEQVINRKDNEGNTALHLAAAAKNFQVVEFILQQHALRPVIVELNAYNKDGWTPLDFSQMGEGDREIREILAQAGAIHGRGRASSLEGEPKTDMRSALLVVAGLVVNATYQSVLQPPTFKTEVDKTDTKGFRAYYADYMTGFFGRDLAYIVFVTGNTFGLLVSVQMIICLTRDLRYKLPMLLSMALMVQTYYCHTYYLPFQSQEKKFGLKNAGWFSVLPLSMPIFLLLLQKPLAQALEFYLGQLSLFDHLRDMYHI